MAAVGDGLVPRHLAGLGLDRGADEGEPGAWHDREMMEVDPGVRGFVGPARMQYLAILSFLGDEGAAAKPRTSGAMGKRQRSNRKPL